MHQDAVGDFLDTNLLSLRRYSAFRAIRQNRTQSHQMNHFMREDVNQKRIQIGLQVLPASRQQDARIIELDAVEIVRVPKWTNLMQMLEPRQRRIRKRLPFEILTCDQIIGELLPTVRWNAVVSKRSFLSLLHGADGQGSLEQ